MIKIQSRKEEADRLLYEYGLLEILREFGNPHIIGSYRMDLMSWNDLDIDIENDHMSLESLYQLTEYIVKAFHPIWYEAKEEHDENGEAVWFHGFETMITGELWNVDLWFLSRREIEKAESFCDKIAEKAAQSPEVKENIMNIKQELQERHLYSFDQYTSMDVYKAVLEYGITNTNDFLGNHKK